jgi:hypothetical protein
MMRLAIVLALVLGCLAITPRAGSGGAAPAPPATEAPATESTRAPDGSEMQYITDYRDIHTRLKREHDRLLENWRDQTEHWNRQWVEQHGRGRRTPYMRTLVMKLKADERDIENRIKDLESRRDALKAEVAKRYEPGVPPAVARQWSETDDDYAVFMDAHRQEIRKQMEARQSIRERPEVPDKPPAADTPPAGDTPATK